MNEVERSAKFDLVKKYYLVLHSWSKRALANAVVRGWITQAEYEEILAEENEE